MLMLTLQTSQVAMCGVAVMRGLKVLKMCLSLDTNMSTYRFMKEEDMRHFKRY